jgi:hypothetical protein
MNRVSCRMAAGFLAVAINLAIIFWLASLSRPHATAQGQTTSTPRGEIAFLGRVVITPGCTQLSQLRPGRQVIGPDKELAAGHRNAHPRPEASAAIRDGSLAATCPLVHTSAATG